MESPEPIYRKKVALPPYAQPVPRLSPKWRDRAIVLVVLVAGSALTLLAGRSLQQAEALRMKERQATTAQSVISAFELALTRTTEAVRNAGLMLESNPQITHEQFNRYMKHTVENQLSVNLMEWQPIVPANRLAQFEAAARTAGQPNFRVVQPDASGAGWEPVRGRGEYVPVLFSWPEQYRTEGLDMSFSPERMASKLQSRAVGQPVASGVFEFMKEGVVKSGSMAVAISTTVFGADREATGYLAAVVDLPTLFQPATRLADAAKLDLLVFASATTEAAPIYAWHGDGSDVKQMTTGLRMATVDDPSAIVDFARQPWKLVLHPRPAFYAEAQENGSRLAYVAGMAMTLLIAMILFRLQISRRHIERAESAARSAMLEQEVLSQRLQEAQRIAHVGSWQLDVATGHIVWSEQLYRMLGLNPEFPPPDYTDQQKSFAPESWERLNTALSRTVEAGVPYEIELEMVKPDGSHGWMLARGEAMREASGSIVGVQGVAVDITERKRAEATRIALEAQLRESQKMEALGTLAGGVAHDFNNALAMILGNVELARQDAGPGHPALVSLEEIGKASRRAKDLVQQILAFGRRQKIERKPTSLALIVVEAARLLRATIPAAVSLNVDCRPDAPAVLADATQVKQVLLNLCSNAAQAVEGQVRPGVIEIKLTAHVAGGTVYMGPERRSGGERAVLGEGRYARLAVKDNGPGMDEATRSRIFEPFFTTKAVGKGTGLGLSVVHGIVQAHEACMEVDSSPGEGSTFRIYFPATEASVMADPAPAADATPLHGKGRRVLYVDDEKAIVSLMKRMLERHGFRVSGYADPHEALAAVRAGPDQFDLVVTDYNMPGMSGMELATALRDIRADLPVVMASGFITEEMLHEAPAAGIRELIYKPNTVGELCQAIARYANAQGDNGIPSCSTLRTAEAQPGSPTGVPLDGILVADQNRP